MTRDPMQHYTVHKQSIGQPVNGKFVWSYEWQVRRPWNHPDMQGDNWERLGYKMFDTFQQAWCWAVMEATKDRIRQGVQEVMDAWT